MKFGEVSPEKKPRERKDKTISEDELLDWNPNTLEEEPIDESTNDTHGYLELYDRLQFRVDQQDRELTILKSKIDTQKEILIKLQTLRVRIGRLHMNGHIGICADLDDILRLFQKGGE